MASEIEIVNLNNFEKIQNFLNDSAYKEILENSENFNTRLCIERRLRMPFLDPQTGVAQTHCALFMKQKQRMPGFREGQIYTYPSARWRKPKRQYLLNHPHSYRAYQYREAHHHQLNSTNSVRDHHQTESAAIVADGNSMSASGDNDSKDSHANPEKDWFHEDLDMSHYHHEDFEEDFESDNDFDESYTSRGKRKRASRSSRRTNAALDGTPKRGRKGGGSRRRSAMTDGDNAGDRRRRGGNQSAAAAAAAAAVAAAASAAASSLGASNSNSASPITNNDESSQSALLMPPTVPGSSNSNNNSMASYEKAANEVPVNELNVAPVSCVLGSNVPTTVPGSVSMSGSNSLLGPSPAAVAAAAAAVAAASATASANGGLPTVVGAAGSPKKEGKNKMRGDREVAAPSPYCDFCLGDQRENKKTHLPEELVSCSDCGRSGHPSCLQFTPNMIISVKRYRWQCIECKYCSICGTSDNDDQLLFCDDCDRGYHMYCLTPPLITPPEGSWSCKLCLEEFHKPAEK